jgi:hypothetical protein
MQTLFELPGLDLIDWSSLEHAYGEADGTADDLRALTAADPEIQRYAVGQLEMSICHQGSLYTAKVAAVPFLLMAAEHTHGKTKADLLGLIASIGESAAFSPGCIAEGVCLRCSLWPNLAERPNPKEIAISEIDTYRAVLAFLVNNIDRFSSLITEIRPELPQEILKSSQFCWSGDFLEYVMSLPLFSEGVAQTVLSEPISLSYQAIAEKLDANVLSGAILWWALQEELAGDESILFKDSLARDLNEKLPEGWNADEMYYEWRHFYWNTWLLKFWHKLEQADKARQHIEQNAVLGWLPRSREDNLIKEAAEIALGTD